ncbi:MAG: glycosyltransferase family 1 protein [Acidobacteriota bacterium]|nr:glycosyltransferase family 1 protein [Acidobacteriota bacterium]
MTDNLPETPEIPNYDLVCLSHLRWDFVYQRPQHLLSRFARERRVFFVEEPTFSDEPSRLDISPREDKLFVVVPRLNHAEAEEQTAENLIRRQLDEMFAEQSIKDFILWYYTPMAVSFTDHLKPQAIVYDCMDELSLFKGAPPQLLKNEVKLFEKADVVFTGGQSLYEAKRNQNPNVWAFPSSIDTAHFNKARKIGEDAMEDQKAIPRPRLGYAGVIDERVDIELIREIAEKRPDWQIVMIGPVVKISEADLPRPGNIHYLGMKDYKDLPSYIAGWDVALMPFALNDSTRFISPTKTPEYLAAGKPVVSTAIRDVVRPYGEQNLVAIAKDADEFIEAAERAMNENRTEKLAAVDKFLLQTSWDKTWRRMTELIAEAIVGNRSKNADKERFGRKTTVGT